MTIREIKIEDYGKLYPFWKENYFVNELDGEKPFRKFLEINPHLSFLVEENGEILGSVLGSFDGRRGYVQKLVVSKKARGQGIGKQLLDLVVEKLKKAGALYIPISCEANMLPFYEKSGFKKTDQVTVGII